MRFSRILVLLVVASLVLSACGPAVQTGADEMTPSGQRFLVELPRIVVDFDSQGRPSIGGVGLSDIESLTGFQLQPIALNPFYVDWMTFTNIQHIELVYSGSGIFIYVNGELIPYLDWDEDSLSNLATAVGVLGQAYANMINLFIPMLTRTGAAVAATFPLQEGAEAVPLRDPSQPPEPAMAEAAELMLVTHVDVDYDDNGVTTIAGITPGDIYNVTGMFVPVGLTPETVDLVQAYGIQSFRVISAPGGIFLEVNGAALPHIAWDSGTLSNGVDLYAQMNPDSPYIELAYMLVPQLGSADVDVKFGFPAQ